MLYLIVKIFQTIVDIFYYIFIISFRIGNLIYDLIKLFAFFIYNVFDVIGRLLVILYEDYATFFRDVNCKVEALLTGINYIIETAVKSTYDAGCTILNQFTYIFTTGKVKMSNVGDILVEASGWLFLNMKAFLILIGNGCWFLITLLPNFIFYMLQLCGILLKYLLQNAILLLVKSYKSLCHGLIVMLNYFADVPIQSAIGLIGVILIYKKIYIVAPMLILISRFMFARFIRISRGIIQWIISNFITVANTIVQLRLPNLTGLFSLASRNPTGLEENPIEDTYQTPPRVNGKIQPGHQHSSGKKLLCVICQDQEKCMLLLPCRHLCVCFDCSRKSRYYNDICPICRIPINDKVRIYV